MADGERPAERSGALEGRRRGAFIGAPSCLPLPRRILSPSEKISPAEIDSSSVSSRARARPPHCPAPSRAAFLLSLLVISVLPPARAADRATLPTRTFSSAFSPSFLPRCVSCRAAFLPGRNALSLRRVMRAGAPLLYFYHTFLRRSIEVSFRIAIGFRASSVTARTLLRELCDLLRSCVQRN